jgi:hypothetical protein
VNSKPFKILKKFMGAWAKKLFKKLAPNVFGLCVRWRLEE